MSELSQVQIKRLKFRTGQYTKHCTFNNGKNIFRSMKLTIENLIKIALILFLILCLFHMPYGFYQLFRYISMVGFAILAYYSYERKNIPVVILFVALALLFQPLSKVPLGRQSWIIIDILVSVGLCVSLVVQNRTKK
jgi:hypothetical protein